MYSAIEVAKYIIDYSNAHNYCVSNLKLQKLLYFVQAYFLISSPDKEPCFWDEIEAWDFGPVVPSVYSELKGFGGASIYGFPSNIVADDSIIEKGHKKLIEDVIEKFRYFTAVDLTRITQRQMPWRKARALNRTNKTVSIEDLRIYFGAKKGME